MLCALRRIFPFSSHMLIGSMIYQFCSGKKLVTWPFVTTGPSLDNPSLLPPSNSNFPGELVKRKVYQGRRRPLFHYFDMLQQWSCNNEVSSHSSIIHVLVQSTKSDLSRSDKPDTQNYIAFPLPLPIRSPSSLTGPLTSKNFRRLIM